MLVDYHRLKQETVQRELVADIHVPIHGNIGILLIIKINYLFVLMFYVLLNLYVYFFTGISGIVTRSDAAQLHTLAEDC